MEITGLDYGTYADTFYIITDDEDREVLHPIVLWYNNVNHYMTFRFVCFILFYFIFLFYRFLCLFGKTRELIKF